MGLLTLVYKGAHFLCASKFQGHELEAKAKTEQLELIHGHTTHSNCAYDGAVPSFHAGPLLYKF